MGRQLKSGSGKSILKAIRTDISNAINKFHSDPNIQNLTIKLPIGIFRVSGVRRVIIEDRFFISEHAKFIIANHPTGLIQRIELTLGKPLTKVFPKNKKYRYYVRRDNPLTVSKLIVSLKNLDDVIIDFVKECNAKLLLYCE